MEQREGERLTSVEAVADLAPCGTCLGVFHTDIEGGVLLLHAFVECLKLLNAAKGEIRINLSRIDILCALDAYAERRSAMSTATGGGRTAP